MHAPPPEAPPPEAPPPRGPLYRPTPVFCFYRTRSDFSDVSRCAFKTPAVAFVAASSPFPRMRKTEVKDLKLLQRHLVRTAALQVGVSLHRWDVVCTPERRTEPAACPPAFPAQTRPLPSPPLPRLLERTASIAAGLRPAERSRLADLQYKYLFLDVWCYRRCL